MVPFMGSVGSLQLSSDDDATLGGTEPVTRSVESNCENEDDSIDAKRGETAGAMALVPTDEHANWSDPCFEQRFVGSLFDALGWRTRGYLYTFFSLLGCCLLAVDAWGFFRLLRLLPRWGQLQNRQTRTRRALVLVKKGFSAMIGRTVGATATPLGNVAYTKSHTLSILR